MQTKRCSAANRSRQGCVTAVIASPAHGSSWPSCPERRSRQAVLEEESWRLSGVRPGYFSRAWPAHPRSRRSARIRHTDQPAGWRHKQGPRRRWVEPQIGCGRGAGGEGNEDDTDTRRGPRGPRHAVAAEMRRQKRTEFVRRRARRRTEAGDSDSGVMMRSHACGAPRRARAGQCARRTRCARACARQSRARPARQRPAPLVVLPPRRLPPRGGISARSASRTPHRGLHPHPQHWRRAPAAAQRPRSLPRRSAHPLLTVRRSACLSHRRQRIGSRAPGEGLWALRSAESPPPQRELHLRRRRLRRRAPLRRRYRLPSSPAIKRPRSHSLRWMQPMEGSQSPDR